MAGYGNFIPSQFHQEKSSLEAAAEAAAKVNAMLIAKGKLRPNQIHNNSQNQKKVNPNNMVAAEVEINDAPLSMRNMLTRGPTQEEITKFSGAAVSTRGRYMPPVEKMKNTSRMGYMTPGEKMKNASSERPLYLFVQGPTQDSVNVAVARINEILTGGKGAGATGGGLVRTGGPPVPQHQLTMPPPHQPPPQNPAQAMLPVPTLEMPPVHQPPPMLAAPVQPPPEMQQITVLEEKLFIGLEHAPPNFDVKGKLLGPGGSYLMHIETETGAKVMLRGKGSGFIDPALGREPFEPMHIIIQHPTVLGMQQAKQLAENLIQTVQQMYASFQQALAALPPPVAPGPTAYISGLQQPTSLAEAALMGPPPGLPTITALPDAQLVPSAPALQPQQAMIVPSSSMSSVMMPAGSLASSLPAINPGQPGGPSMLLNTTLSMAPVPVVTTLPISSQTPLQLQPPPTALELGQQQLIMSQAPPPQPLQMTLAPQMSVQTSMPASMASLASLPTQLAPAPGPHGLNPAALQPPGVQLVSQPAPVAPPPMLAAPPAPVSGPAQSQPFQAMYTPEVVSSGPMLTPGLTSLVVSTTPSSHIYSLATSSSMVSHTPGPSKDTADPARRRFTEDKDDKIPDSLLGYQHGPPHLVNLVCSSPPPGSQNQPGLHPNPPTLIPGQTPGQAAFQPGPQPGLPPHHPQLAAAPQPQPIAMLPAQPGLPPQPQPGVPAGQIELQPAHPGLPAAMAPGHPANPASFAMPQAFQVQTIHTLPAQLPPPPNSLSPVSQAYHVPPSSMPDDNRFGVPVSSSAGGMMPPPPPPGAMGMSPSSSGEQSNGPRQLMPPPARHDGQPWGGPAHGVKRGMSNEEGGEQDRKRRKENGFEEDDNSSQSPSAQSESPKPGTPTQGHVPRSQNHSPVREGPPQDSFEQQPPHPPPPPPPPHHPQGVFPQQQAPPQFEPGMALPPQQILHPGPHLNGSHQAPPFDPAGQPPPPPLHQQFVEPGTQPPPPPLQFQEIGQQFAPPPNSQGELGPFHHPQGPPQGQGEIPHPFPPPPGHAGGPPGELGHPFAHGVPAASQGELGHTVSSQPPSHAPYPLSQSFSQPGPQAHFINTLPVSSSNTFLPAPHFIPQHAPGTRHHPHPHGPPPPPPPPPPTSQYQHGPPQGYWHN